MSLSLAWKCRITCAALAASTFGCATRDPRAVDQLTPELEPVVRGNNDFAFALYKEAAKRPGNLFFSPMSISAAFGMTYAGARGETAAEMRRVLAIQPEDAVYHAQFGALLADLGGDHTRGYRLSIANRLFGADRYDFAEPFVALTGSAYGAPLERIDFTSGEGATPINDWVADQTDDAIPRLFEEELAPETVLVLVNAIHFAADWKDPFDEAATKAEAFFRANGETVQAPMMNGKASGYVHSDELSIVTRSYADEEIEMVVVIPEGEHTLAEIEPKLDGAWFDERLAERQDRRADLALPRFELHTTLPLREHLDALGMNLPFGASSDLSGMVASGQPELVLTKVVHQAFVRVHERGTEAAAATGVVVEPRSTHPHFRADRPFLFVIRDRLTSSILFIGRLEDPSLDAVSAN